MPFEHLDYSVTPGPGGSFDYSVKKLFAHKFLCMKGFIWPS